MSPYMQIFIKRIMNGNGANFPEGQWWEIFSLRHRLPNGSESHQACYPMGTGGSFPGGRADPSPPSSAEVKNAWSYTSNPQYIFMAW
jgi:hypothetical protein